MTRDKLLGQTRELLTAGAAILAAYGYTNDQYLALWTGVIIALASLIFGVVKHEGKKKLWSLGRKLINVGGAVAVYHGYTNPEQMGAMLGIFGPALALIGSSASNDADDRQGTFPKAHGFLWILLLIPCFVLSGCAGSGIGNILGKIEPRITNEGIVLLGFKSDSGNSYWTNLVTRETDKKLIIEWTADQTDGSHTAIQFVRHEGGATSIRYWGGSGIWIEWSSKSGVMLGAVPEAVSNQAEW